MQRLRKELIHNKYVQGFELFLQSCVSQSCVSQNENSFMNIKKTTAARCGACRFYTPIGRRGGECSQFGVPVQSAWTSCSLAESPFQKITKISKSSIKLAKNTDRELTKLTIEKEVTVESLPMPVGRFQLKESTLTKQMSS
ncbi:hypothetical protein IQ260_18400 [Leptolyngbya cf. ectocarpi LEGE 11479]|uniref:Uncharacterized protein n=1 Tax=Leptolyngbya cf. ectocarpi LEGE 11479 TaxID=1828722 RepID=A0A929FB09_LEPEC|nr:hypothetical protein [Leptolyngbya ectocarpi]MBE9068619.1 hypothetical protein [Leptolyngbya cf. ectocarpi LEGE 11479]